MSPFGCSSKRHRLIAAAVGLVGLALAVPSDWFPGWKLKLAHYQNLRKSA
jgi:hypothetical protein